VLMVGRLLRERRNVYPIEEMPRNHVLLFLLNILQTPGHNEFRVANGSLVAVDVDRAEFNFSPRAKTGFGCVLCQHCSFLTKRTD
jgi:hypothetical protein